MYFVEDLFGSCYGPGWQVMGDASRWVKGGSADCMGSKARPTFFARLVEWQKDLTRANPKPLFSHVDVHAGAAAFELCDSHTHGGCKSFHGGQ